MKNQEIVTTAPSRTSFYAAPSPVPTSVVVQNYTRMIDSIDRVSTVTNGDFHSPNDHEYRVQRTLYPYGSLNEYSRSPPGITREQVWNLGGVMNPRQYIGDAVVDQETMLYNRALSRLNEKARGSLDLSVSALEMSQTIRMLRNAGSIQSYLGNFIRALGTKRTTVSADSSLKQLVRDMGGNWLQFHLGLMPLLNDFHDSIKEMNTAVVPLVSRISAKASVPIEVKSVPTGLFYSSIAVPKVEGVQGVQFHVQFRPVDAFNALRWASLSPLSWAWEAVTLSFVFDWFYNVSAMLRDTETALAYKNTFDSGYVTFLKAYNGSVTCKGRINLDSNRFELADFVGNYDFKHFRRVKLVAWPLPRLPAFRADLGAKQLLTAASLLALQLRRT